MKSIRTELSTRKEISRIILTNRVSQGPINLKRLSYKKLGSSPWTHETVINCEDSRMKLLIQLVREQVDMHLALLRVMARKIQEEAGGQCNSV